MSSFADQNIPPHNAELTSGIPRRKSKSPANSNIESFNDSNEAYSPVKKKNKPIHRNNSLEVKPLSAGCNVSSFSSEKFPDLKSEVSVEMNQGSKRRMRGAPGAGDSLLRVL